MLLIYLTISVLLKIIVYVAYSLYNMYLNTIYIYIYVNWMYIEYYHCTITFKCKIRMNSFDFSQIQFYLKQKIESINYVK